MTLVTLAALALRAVTLGESLWLDELHTSWVVRGNFGDVGPRAAAGNQAPLYYASVWLLMQFVPMSEITLRAISWLAGGALVAAVGLVARRWTADRSLSLLAAALVAGDPNCVYFSREARPYALLALLALAHVVVFRRRLTLGDAQWPRGRGTRLRIAWVALSWTLFYTHYTSLLLIVAELVYVITTRRGRRSLRCQAMVSWTVDLVCITVGCLPALPDIRSIAQRRDNWSQFVKPRGITSIGTLFPCELYVAAPIVLAALVLTYHVWRGQPAISTRRLRVFLPLLACWYVVPVGLAWAATYSGLMPILHRRYVWSAVPALFLHAPLWGTIAAHRQARRWFATIHLVLGIAFWASLPVSTWHTHSREDWRAALSVIANDEVSSEWPVLLRAGLIEDRQLDERSTPAFREYCSFALRGLYSIEHRPGALIALPSDGPLRLDAPVRDMVTAAGGAWFVERGSGDRTLQGIEQWRDRARSEHIANRNVKRHSFPGVTVIAVRTAPEPPIQ